MRRWQSAAAITLIAGCNSVFGIGETAPAPPSDAAYFDAPPDAPYACPPTGAPMFSPYVHQAYVQFDCFEYSASSDGFGVARCAYPAQTVNGTLVSIPELTDFGAYGNPRIAPEGDTLYVTRDYDVRVYARMPNGSWIQEPSLVLPFQVTSLPYIGAPSMGPQRHIMFMQALDTDVKELALDAAGTATVVHSYAPGDFGVTSFGRVPMLTADGLHMVFVANTASASGALFYAARSSVDAGFGAATQTSLAGVNDPFMTADCGHLYFTAVGSVVYVTQ